MSRSSLVFLTLSLSLVVPALGCSSKQKAPDSAASAPSTSAKGGVVVSILDRLKLPIAFVGVGPADFHGPLEEGDNFFTAEQLAEVRKAGAVGQLHQRYIDANGNPVKTDLDDKVISITLSQLRRVKRKIAVAGGAAKHQALAGALAGKWIDVLVTDVNTANYLMAAPRGTDPTPKGTA